MSPAIPPVNPDITQDVQCTTSPKDANGLQTTPQLAWDLAGPGQVTVAPDTLSALVVTPESGDFTSTLTVRTPEGLADSVIISRSAETGGITTVIGLGAELVPKSGGPGILSSVRR